jgi:hypothetical protein
MQGGDVPSLLMWIGLIAAYGWTLRSLARRGRTDRGAHDATPPPADGGTRIVCRPRLVWTAHSRNERAVPLPRSEGGRR